MSFNDTVEGPNWPTRQFSKESEFLERYQDLQANDAVITAALFGRPNHDVLVVAVYRETHIPEVVTSYFADSLLIIEHEWNAQDLKNMDEAIVTSGAMPEVTAMGQGFRDDGTYGYTIWHTGSPSPQLVELAARSRGMVQLTTE